MPKRKFTEKNINKVKTRPCAYSLYNTSGSILRNGSTKNCRRRLNEHYGQFPNVSSFSARMTKSSDQAHNIEKLICKKFRPSFNLKCG